MMHVHEGRDRAACCCQTALLLLVKSLRGTKHGPSAGAEWHLCLPCSLAHSTRWTSSIPWHTTLMCARLLAWTSFTPWGTQKATSCSNGSGTAMCYSVVSASHQQHRSSCHCSCQNLPADQMLINGHTLLAQVTVAWGRL